MPSTEPWTNMRVTSYDRPCHFYLESLDDLVKGGVVGDLALEIGDVVSVQRLGQDGCRLRWSIYDLHWKDAQWQPMENPHG